MSEKTNIFLVRHGQTQWNHEKRLQGHKNSPLTEAGRQQAIQARKSLQGCQIDKAYVSPLLRAQDTLQLILEERNIEIIISENLKEISLGPWEGKTKSETKLSHPEQYHHFWENQEQFNLSGAETYQQLQNRVVKEIETIFIKEKGKNIIVVSHWIAIKVALAHYKSIPLNSLSSLPNPKNGAFTILSD